jgi:hypothetical protein
MDELPDDWRTRMTRLVASRVPADGALFTGSATLSPLEQIGVYRRQYELRLYEALRDELLGLSALLDHELGRAAAKQQLWAFLRAHPSRSWTLSRVADGIVEWLDASGAPVQHIEMARLDRAVQQGFEARDGRPITPEALATLPRLRLQPPVRLLRLTTDVHRFRTAAVTDEEEAPDPIRTGLDVPLVVFRRGQRMRTWELKPGAWRVLERLSEGAALQDAITAPVEEGLVAPERLHAEIEGWFKDFAQHQLVEVC